MKLRDVCPCRLGTFPDVILTTGMVLMCTEGHRITVAFNYLPKELNYAKRQQESKLATDKTEK